MGQGQQQAPSAGDKSGWVGDIAGGVSAIAEGMGLDGLAGVAGIVNGVAGAGKDGSEFNPWGFLGNTYSAAGGIMEMMGSTDTSMIDTLGMLGSGLGAVNGFVGAFADDPDKGFGDRALDFADGTANGLTFLSQVAGSGGLAGAGVGGAATLGGSGAGAALAAGGATSLAAAGAVLGAGVAGVKAGLAINDVNNSDYARSSMFGQNESGQDRTAYEAVQDGALSVGSTVEDWTGSETMGLIAGGTTAALGSIAAAPVGLLTAAGNGIASWFD